MRTSSRRWYSRPRASNRSNNRTQHHQGRNPKPPLASLSTPVSMTPGASSTESITHHVSLLIELFAQIVMLVGPKVSVGVPLRVPLIGSNVKPAGRSGAISQEVTVASIAAGVRLAIGRSTRPVNSLIG